MKYLKEYINYHSYTNVKYKDHAFLTGDLLSDIGLDIEKKSVESIYDIDVSKILEEIYLNKKVQFYNTSYDKWETGIVNNVNLSYWYKSNYQHIIVEIDGTWRRICDKHFNKIFDYDAENKPEHMKLKMIKDVNKYNI